MWKFSGVRPFTAFLILATFATVSFLLVGCAADSSQYSYISLDGSTSMEKVVGFLSEAYQEDNPNVKISYNPTGSGAGIRAVIEGSCDIALSSRALTDEEMVQLDSTVIAVDAVAITVNSENTVDDITLAELADIYTGKITNWMQLGGDDLPIVCIGREAASGTRDGFEQATGTSDRCAYSQELTSSGDVVQTVAANPNAIGYCSLEAVGDKTKLLKIDGVLPDEQTILDGSYKISRDFIFVTAKDTALSQAAEDFLSFVCGDRAAEYISKAGAVAVAK